MKKTTAAPPPPPQRAMSEASSSGLTGDSDSAGSVESGLEGRMRLGVVLPDGTAIQMEVERRTAMMDLLVQVTKAHNLNPGSYALDVKSTEPAPYKPNTPIGTLNATAVHIVPRVRDPNSIHRDVKTGTKPFEKTFRLRVHLPRNQLYVLRVSPRTPLAEVFAAICSEKGLNPSKYELRHPVHDEVQLDHARCLADYDLSEVTLVTLKDSSGGSMKHLDAVGSCNTSVSSQEQAKKKHGILSFMFKKTKLNSAVDVTTDVNKKTEPAAPVYCEVINSASPPATMTAATASSSDTSSASNKSVKKRQAPPPPPLLRHHDRQTSLPATKTSSEQLTSGGGSGGDGVTTFAASHSRHSSDSSGYHESSILSDSPETIISSAGADLPCSLHFKGRKAASTTNIHLVDSTSSLSVSSTGTKKRKAPPPPMRSSTLPPTSKQSTSSSSSISVSETAEQLSNGSLGSSTISRQDSSSSRSSVSAVEVAPVPRPRHCVSPIQSVQPEPEDDVILSHEAALSAEHVNGIESRLTRRDSAEASPIIGKATETEVIENHVTTSVPFETSTLSRHSSNSSMDVITIGDEKTDFSRTNVCEVHDENLKNVRKNSAAESKLSNDQVAVETTLGTDDVDEEEAISQIAPPPQSSEEDQAGTVLADAINEFHNETNSMKMNLTDLWSQVVTLPPGDDVVNLPTVEDDNDDKLSLDEENHLFDMPASKEDSNNEVKRETMIEASRDVDASGHINDLSANNLDIQLDNQQSAVPEEQEEEKEKQVETVNERVISHDDVTKMNNFLESVDAIVQSDNAEELAPGDHEVDQGDLVVTWEYRIPDVPVEFQNDPPKDEDPPSLPAPPMNNNSVSTKSLTTVYTSDRAAPVSEKQPKALEDRHEATEPEQQQQQQEQLPVERRIHRRKPVVQFSISTYRSRASEETSYQDKLGRVDSFSTSTSDRNGVTAEVIEPVFQSQHEHQQQLQEQQQQQYEHEQQEQLEQHEEQQQRIQQHHQYQKQQIQQMQSQKQQVSGEQIKPRNDVIETKDATQCDRDNGNEPVKDVQQLQAEYSKLQQQFIQWQRQLLTNQNLLQKQNVLPESTSTTNSLKPLQEFQEQFTSLPPLTKSSDVDIGIIDDDNQHRHQVAQQPEVDSTQSMRCSVNSRPSAAVSSRNSVAAVPVAAHGPRPWRPVSVDLSAWTQRTKFEEYGSKSLNFTSRSEEPRLSATAEVTTVGRKASLSKERTMTSFNDHNVNNRPVVKVNRQVSHAAAFPRHPVVRGFATLPQNSSTEVAPLPPAKVATTQQEAVIASKKGLRTVTYFGDPVVNRSAKASTEDENQQQQQQRHVSQVQLSNNRVVTNHLLQKSQAMKLQPQQQQPQTTTQVNGANSKFCSVVSIGHAAARQQVTSFAPPPPPPPPQPKIGRTTSNKMQQQTKIAPATNTADDRDELMTAIRDFGGRFGLKKVSAIETRWQSRHGNVN